VSLNAKRGEYPYSRNRVFLSVAVALMSILLVLMTLLGDATLMIYYTFATCVVIVITFLLKKRFYSLLTTEAHQKTTDEDKRTSWKALIATFLMLIGLTMVPLLLAGLLSGPAWFIMITSLTSGVSISEIGLYVQANRNR